MAFPLSHVSRTAGWYVACRWIPLKATCPKSCHIHGSFLKDLIKLTGIRLWDSKDCQILSHIFCHKTWKHETKTQKKPPVSFSWSKNWGWYCPILPMVLVNGVEGIGWDLPLCHSVFFMDSDAKKSSLRRSSLTLHGSKEHFFQATWWKPWNFTHKQENQGKSRVFLQIC